MLTTPTRETSVSSPTPSSSGHASNNGGLPFSDEDPRRRQKLLIGGIGGVILVVALALLFIFRPWNHGPKLGGDPVQLGQYAASSDFRKMPFDKRELYMKMMDSKKDEISKSYAAGQLSLEDYQKALLAGHLGKRLDEMHKYFAKPVGPERVKYLDKILNKKDTKEEAAKHNPSAKEQKKEKDVLKDDAAEKAEIATWPEDVQAQYQEFHAALEDRKKLHKEVKAEAKAATRPATPAMPVSP